MAQRNDQVVLSCPLYRKHFVTSQFAGDAEDGAENQLSVCLFKWLHDQCIEVSKVLMEGES